MNRFYFDIDWHGETFQDPDGKAFSHDIEAVAYALRIAAELSEGEVISAVRVRVFDRWRDPIATVYNGRIVCMVESKNAVRAWLDRWRMPASR